MAAHLRPTAAIAPDALLPGDPKRAMELATSLMDKPVMSNLSRGLWGYHGHTADGRELTVQATGIGGPSAAVVVAELAQLGVRRAIRVGTCIALDPDLTPGQTVVAEAVLASDGVGSRLGDGRPDEALGERLAAAVEPARHGIVASTDLYYEPDPERRHAWRRAGAVAVDLSASAVIAVGRRAGLAVGCVLLVAESVAGRRLAEEELDTATLALGERAAAALAQDPLPAP